MERIRILIANEPRYYREVMVAGIQALRPDVDVVAVEPANLAASVLRLHPDVVVCHGLDDALVADPLA